MSTLPVAGFNLTDCTPSNRRQLFPHHRRARAVFRQGRHTKSDPSGHEMRGLDRPGAKHRHQRPAAKLVLAQQSGKEESGEDVHNASDFLSRAFDALASGKLASQTCLFCQQNYTRMVRRENHTQRSEPVLQSYATCHGGFPKAWFPAKIVCVVASTV